MTPTIYWPDAHDVLVKLDGGWVRQGPFETREEAERIEAMYPPGEAVVCRAGEGEEPQ